MDSEQNPYSLISETTTADSRKIRISIKNSRRKTKPIQSLSNPLIVVANELPLAMEPRVKKTVMIPRTTAMNREAHQAFGAYEEI